MSLTADLELLAPYVTNLDRPVFALRNLPEEVVAVLFAYYSRSPLSLRDNLAKLLREGDLAMQPALLDEGDGLEAARDKARAFHEKWVVGYGHSSVAEHAVVHLAIEDVSIVATKVIEDNRLASYTEKSTRYVPFDAEMYVREPDIAAGPLAGLYDQACRGLLALYAELMPRVTEQVKELAARPEEWTERRWESVCRARACDILRYLLPAATRTNLGLTCNARTLEHLLTKLYSHPLAELRELAALLQAEATKMVPTLIKYAAPNEYLRQTRESVADLAAEMLPAESGGAAVRLVRAPDEPLAELATAILYQAGGAGWESCRAAVGRLDAARQGAVIEAYLAARGPYDEPLRALEHLTYTHEILVDYGAYRDIQRHRLCTQTGQVLTPAHGYDTPPEIELLGHGPAYQAAMDQSITVHERLAAEHGLERAQYVLPLACRKRLLITWNLRELFHFIELRSGKQGHVSYRRVAQECWRELNRVHPELARHVRVDLNDYAWARA